MFRTSRDGMTGTLYCLYIEPQGMLKSHKEQRNKEHSKEISFSSMLCSVTRDIFRDKVHDT